MRNKSFYYPLMIAMLLLLCTPFVTVVYAQSFTVTGTVADSQGGVPGVNVKVKGSTTGTITDMDGKFTLNVPSSKSVLVISYIGYTTQEIPVNNQKILNINLKEDTKVLDEVVVVGYGVQKKSHLTGSVSKMDVNNLTDIPVTQVDQLLQGKIAGVNIQNSTSEAGAAPQIRVRGMGSISADSSPLIVIDGYPVPEGLSTLDMADIASIEVLKDAASAAIYGSRAANGVILVTTKEGNASKAKYSVKASTGLKWAYKLHPIMSSKDYYNMMGYEAALQNKSIAANDEAFGLINNYTDWQREGLQDTPQIHQVQLSVSGGKKDITYYISGNYAQEDGIMINSNYKRLNLRSRINAKLSKRVDLSLNIAPSYTKTETPSTNFIDFYRTPSFMPVRHTEETAALTGKAIGSWARGSDFSNIMYTREDGTQVKASPFNTSNNNPKSLMDTEERFKEDYNLQANSSINVQIMKGLTFTTSNGFYIKYRQNNEYRNYESRKDEESAMGTYKNRLYVDLLSENTLNYIGKKGKHDYAALLGYTAQTTSETTASIVGLGFPTDYVHTLNAATSFDVSQTNTIKFRTAMMSALARVNYSYADKYLVSASLRTDGSSLFADGKQWGWFPSVSLGWRASEEAFLKGVSWLNMLKLRASFGVTGNNNIPANSYYNLLYASNYALGSGTGALIPGLGKTTSTKGNHDITWEQTYEYNAGIDFSALDNRISLTLEGYYSITKQLLFKQPVVSFMGYSDYWNNIGRIRNSGIEIELNTHNIRTKNFEWTTSFNLSSNFNKLLELSGEERLISTGERNETYLAQVGHRAISFFGYKTDGVYLNQADLDASPHLASATPGSLKIVDINDDGVINDKDRTVIGNPFPKATWGISNTFRWKGFDLYFLIQGVSGLDVFNGDGYYTESKKFNRNYVKDRWISAEYPGNGRTPTVGSAGISWEFTDYMIEDGSFVALRDVVLGYTFDKKKLKKAGLNSLRLYASGQNLLYFWGKSYRGINPEARVTTGSYSSPLVNGYQRGGFPIQSTVNIGFELNF